MTNSSLIVIENDSAWKNQLNEFDTYDFYHTYDYHQLSKKPTEKAILIKYTEDDKIICLPLIIRPIESTLFFDATSVYGYAGPLTLNVDSKFENKFFRDTLVNFFKENNIISVFSRLNPFIKNQEFVLKNIGDTVKLGNIVNIDITLPLNEQRTIFSKTTKRFINKSRKQIDVKISKDKTDILEFIKLYYENMDRVNANERYYFSEDYFLKFISSNDFEVDVLFATYKEANKIISGAIMVKTKNIIQYHLSGTKSDYLHLSPIRLLIDEMRIKASQENYTYFNLGGGLGNEDDELFRFKSSFSNNYKNFEIWKLVVNQKIYDALVREKSIEANTNYFPLYRHN